MTYFFNTFKNVLVMNDVIFLKDSGKEDTVFESVGVIQEKETLEQAMTRIGISFDSTYSNNSTITGEL